MRNPGFDYLAAVKFPNLILKYHPPGATAGFFTNTFGDALPVIDRFLSLGQCPKVRLHLQWKDQHDYNERDIRVAVRECERVMPLILKYRGRVEFFISPWCEHKAPLSLIKKLHREITKVLQGQARYVNSPMKGGALLPGELDEFHGAHTRPPKRDNYLFSFDGTAAPDADVESYKKNYSKAELFFIWDARFNGRWETNDKTPRPSRRGWPDRKLLESLHFLFTSRGSVRLPARWLYKSHSENKGSGDLRAEKPVIICPPQAREITLQVAGKVLARFTPPRPPLSPKYVDGRFRYYTTKMGYEIAKEAIALQGHPLVEVWMNGKQVGTVNPGFRHGEYRIALENLKELRGMKWGT